MAKMAVPYPIAQTHRHRHRITRCLPKGRGGNLDDPEEEGDLGDLGQGLFRGIIHLGLTAGSKPSLWVWQAARA